jgi:adenylate kinase family enzyme
MSRFEDIQTKLENLSPIPVNMPKLYLLGDTGAGKTTIVKKILGTNAYKFPSVLQKRCTVAVTEYVLCKDLPYKATYIFKNEEQVNEFVKEILEISIEKAYLSYRKKELSRVNVAEDIEETPDERFRLKYILSTEQLEDVVSSIVELLPYLDKAVDSLKIELQSKEEEIGVVVDLALEQNNEIKEILDKIKAKIFDCIKNKVSELCEGFALFSDVDFYQHSSADIESFVEQGGSTWGRG